MKIHEYQAKEILRKYGVPVPEGEMVTTLEDADRAAKQLFSAGNPVVVVKAQIHAGGRGKGTFKEADAGGQGGVRITRSVEEAGVEVGDVLDQLADPSGSGSAVRRTWAATSKSSPGATRADHPAAA